MDVVIRCQFVLFGSHSLSRIAALLGAKSIKVTLIAYIHGLHEFSLDASIDISLQ